MFSKILGFISSNKDKQDTDTYANKRLHHRWLNNKDLFALESESESYKIDDIGYGGLKLIGRLDDLTAIVYLKYLDEKIEVQLEEAYGSNIASGYRFIHDDSNTLIFLRPIIENIRKGNTVQIISPDFCQPPFNTAEWQVLRAEGPIDITINKQTKEINYTYLSDGSYKTIQKTNQQLKYFISSDPSGTATRMTESHSLAKSEIANVIAQIHGISHKIESNQLLAELERELINTIN